MRNGRRRRLKMRTIETAVTAMLATLRDYLLPKLLSGDVRVESLCSGERVPE